VVVVAISGPHGVGKSTVAKSAARRFGLKYVSAGEIFRRLAEERGMDLQEFSKYVERHPGIDRRIDGYVKKMAGRGNVLVDGRLAGWMIKDADLKVMLVAPLEIRVERMVGREGRGYEEVMEETLARERSEKKRFKRLYGIDVDDCSVFDLVINTGRLSVEEEVTIIGKAIEMIRRRAGGGDR